MLDEVRLVDVPPPDRGARGVDRGCVLVGRPGRLPAADREPTLCQVGRRIGSPGREQRQRARLGWRRRRVAPQGLGQAIGEVDVGALAVA